MEPLTALFLVMLISIALSIVMSLFYRFLIDQKKMRAIKNELKELNEKMTTARKSKNEKELKVLMEKSLKLNNQQMMMNMKPMLAGILVWTIPLYTMPALFGGILFKLPFWMPLFGPDVSWLGLYIIISFPVIVVTRKLLGVD